MKRRWVIRGLAVAVVGAVLALFALSFWWEVDVTGQRGMFRYGQQGLQAEYVYDGDFIDRGWHVLPARRTVYLFNRPYVEFGHFQMVLVPWWMVLGVAGAMVAFVFRVTRRRGRGAGFPVMVAEPEPPTRCVGR